MAPALRFAFSVLLGRRDLEVAGGPGGQAVIPRWSSVVYEAAHYSWECGDVERAREILAQLPEDPKVAEALERMAAVREHAERAEVLEEALAPIPPSSL